MILKRIFSKRIVSMLIGLGALAGAVAYPQYAPFIDKGMDIICEAMVNDNGTDILQEGL